MPTIRENSTDDDNVIVLLLLTILGFVIATWRSDRIASWLFMPYAIWVAYATLLNLSILVLN